MHPSHLLNGKQNCQSQVQGGCLHNLASMWTVFMIQPESSHQFPIHHSPWLSIGQSTEVFKTYLTDDVKSILQTKTPQLPRRHRMMTSPGFYELIDLKCFQTLESLIRLHWIITSGWSLTKEPSIHWSTMNFVKSNCLVINSDQVRLFNGTRGYKIIFEFPPELPSHMLTSVDWLQAGCLVSTLVICCREANKGKRGWLYEQVKGWCWQMDTANRVLRGRERALLMDMKKIIV